MTRSGVAIGLLSLSLLAYQLALMQVLSLTQWHHFASLVIALALLGFGASGTALAMTRERAHRLADEVLPWSMLLAGLLMPASVALAQVAPFRFDSLRVFVDPSGLSGVLLTSVLVSLPFFLGATAIGLALSLWPSRSPGLYFSNLAGSGAGTIASLAVMWWLEPARLPAVWGLCAVGAGLLLARSRLSRVAALLALGVTLWLLARPPGLVMSEFKGAAAALRLPGARVVNEAPSPEGLVQVIRSPALRSAPGVSLTFEGDIPPLPVVYTNGSPVGPLVAPQDSASARMLGATTMALPFAIRRPRSALILDAGSGALVTQTRANGVARVVAVEPNERVVELVAPLYRQEEQTVWHATSPRTYLERTDRRYDLVTVPPVGAFGGGAGLSALQEEYTLTVESLSLMWSTLSDDGMLCLTVWMDYPPRMILKLAATFAELSAEARIDVARHLVAVRGWGTATFLLARFPLDTSAVSEVRAFCRRHGFDPLVMPGLRQGERMAQHALQDTTLFAALDAILTGKGETVEAASPFRIAPARDERPYFYQFLRLDRLTALARLFGEGGLPYVEAGYAVVLLTGGVVLSLALVLIVIPLVTGHTERPGRTGWGLVFAALGAGYMAAEIALIQRFVPLLGSTVTSAGIVIGALLVSSGAGSLASGALPAAVRSLRAVAALVLVLLVGLYLALPLILPALVGLDGPLRIVSAVVLVALPGFFMGMPFPLGLRLIGRDHPANIPWVWGVNGGFSVAGASLAPVGAVELGLSAVLGAAAAAYLVVTAAATARITRRGAGHDLVT